MIVVAPYNTDAPIYHYPIATASIIVINVIVFFFTTLQAMLGSIEFESIQWLCLEFTTVNPVQWVTAAFMHGDPMHLIGNMIFLWTFGMVVEGKIGTKAFLLIYLLIALGSMAIIQIPMFLFGSVQFALGASGVIFGLMAMSIIWAPENEMGCFYWLGIIWWGVFDVRIVTLGAIYILLQVVTILLTQFAMSGAMGHMAGVLFGAPIALYMLREEMVDCEGWDLVTRSPWMHQYKFLCGDRIEREAKQLQREEELDADPIAAALAIEGRSANAGKLGIRSTTAPANAKSLQSKQPENSNVSFPALAHTTASPTLIQKARESPEFNRLAFSLRQSIQTANCASAKQAFMQLDLKHLAVGLSEAMLVQYIAFLGTHQQWSDSIRPLQLVVNLGGQHGEDAKIRIARIELQVMQNPALALQTLNSILPAHEESTDAHKARIQERDALIAYAKQMQSQN